MTSDCQPAPQVYRIAELNAAQIRLLDREKTAVFLPGGILEEHGPYLPCFTDGYLNEWLTCRLANAVASRPGWTALIFPTIPLGTGGANEIGEKYSFPGTYTVRTSTLRAVFMDLATELGEQGFRWIFVMHLHGAPNHNRILDQACAYFNDMYMGKMVNLSGLEDLFPLDDGLLTIEDQQAAGLDPHAGTGETSWILAVQPGLVNPAYKNAISQRGESWVDLMRIAKDPDWPGYFSSPANADASYGAAFMKKLADMYITVVNKVLDGEDLDSIPRYAEIMEGSAPNLEIDHSALEEEARRQRKQDEWLKKRGLRA